MYAFVRENNWNEVNQYNKSQELRKPNYVGMFWFSQLNLNSMFIYYPYGLIFNLPQVLKPSKANFAGWENEKPC